MDMVCASLAFIDGLGSAEMALIFVVVLVLFGGQKLPEFARGLGKTLREFKKAAAGVEEEFKRALDEDERKNATPKLMAPPATPALPAAAAAATVTDLDPPGPEAHNPTYDEYGNEILPETTPDRSPPAPFASGNARVIEAVPAEPAVSTLPAPGQELPSEHKPAANPTSPAPANRPETT